MLCRLALMVQAAVLDGQFLDLFSPFNDGRVPAEESDMSVRTGQRCVANHLGAADGIAPSKFFPLPTAKLGWGQFLCVGTVPSKHFFLFIFVLTINQ
jgi:hypothetical protein